MEPIMSSPSTSSSNDNEITSPYTLAKDLMQEINNESLNNFHFKTSLLNLKLFLEKLSITTTSTTKTHNQSQCDNNHNSNGTLLNDSLYPSLPNDKTIPSQPNESIKNNTKNDTETIKKQIASSLLSLDRVVESSISPSDSRKSHQENYNRQTISLYSSSKEENEIEQLIDQCLDLCGSTNVLVAANDCLIEASSQKRQHSLTLTMTNAMMQESKMDEKLMMKPIPPYSVLLSIRTLKRMLITSTVPLVSSTSTKKENPNKFYIELLSPSSIQMTEDYINELARMMVMLPIRIASALHASRLASSLPLWATRTKYFSRLIGNLISMVSFLPQQKKKDRGKPVESLSFTKTTSTIIPTSLNTSESEYKDEKGISAIIGSIPDSNDVANMELLLQSVMKLMIRHGGTDDVAQGFFQFFLKFYGKCSISNESTSNTNIPNRDKSTIEKGEDDPFRDKFKSFVCRCIISLNNPRESVGLLRSLIKCISAECTNKSLYESNKSVDSIERLQKHQQFQLMLSYLRDLCLPTFMTYQNIRDYCIRSLILSPKLSDCPDIFMSWSIATMLFIGMQMYESSAESTKNEAINEEGQNIVRQRIGYPMDTYLSYLKEIIEVWSQSTFLHHTDLSAQSHMTNFILKSLSLMIKGYSNSSKSEDNLLFQDYAILIPILVQGVTIRLESSILEVRKHGMKVAESFAPLTGETLSFEELREMEEDELLHIEYNVSENKNTLSGDNLLKGKEGESQKVEKKKGKHKARTKESFAITVDPDEEYFSDDETSSSTRSSICSEQHPASNEQNQEVLNDSDDDNSVWDSSTDGDDNLIPFDVYDDEEDLRPIPQPIYLSECLSLLRSPENDKETYDRHEISLKTLPTILESHPLDLPDLAVPLVNDVLHLENKFDMPQFQTMRMTCLIKLAVSEPILVGEYLVKEKVLEDGISLATRLEILEVIEAMSEHLCGSKDLEQMRENQKQSLKCLNKEKVSGKRHLVKAVNSESTTEDKQESKTRRWGRLNRGYKGENTVTNKFGPISPLLFYTLLAKFAECKENSNIWSGANGVHLISKFILTLSSVVKCSGFYPGTSVLATELYAFIWSFRESENAEVRQAVLLSLAVCLPFLPESVLVEALYKSKDLIYFLEMMQTEDTDGQCRQLAKMIYSNISSNLELLTVSSGTGRTIHEL